MILYAKDLEKAKQGEGGIPDRQKLSEARKDLDKVLSVRPCLRTHLEMAQVGVKTVMINNWVICANWISGIMSFLLGILLHGCRCTPGKPFSR